MVVAEQVQEAVDEEDADFGQKRAVALGGLARGGVEGDYDVAEDLGGGVRG